MQEQNVKICKGAACKAWSSDQVARELLKFGEELDLEGIKVCRVSCMKACGGGTSIRINSKPEVVKLKEVEDVWAVLSIQEAGLVTHVA